MSQVAEIQLQADIPETIAAALADADAQVRAEAIEGLSECSPKAAIARLIELAQDDPEPIVRCAALIGLGEVLYSCGASAYDPETDHDALLQCEELPPDLPSLRERPDPQVTEALAGALRKKLVRA